jgi:hypothetical protein
LGTDLFGWIEVRLDRARPDAPWEAAVCVTSMLGRNYDAFGCLFGVRNYAGFEPVAAGRGVPDDCSDEVRRELPEFEPPYAPLGSTWLTATELAAIDWDERALRPDLRVHRYRRTRSGELLFIGKSVWDRNLAAILEHRDLGDPVPPYPEGTEWRTDDVVFRVETIRRRDAVDADWWLVFRQIDDLAEHLGGDNVRMVAWFDD